MELPAKFLDLVSELGRVLKAELLDLLGTHALHLPAPAAAPPGDGRRLEREELGYVGDALDDRLRRDAVLLVVAELDVAATVRLVDGALDRLRQLVGVHDNLAVHVSRGTPDCLNERRLAAEEALLVRVD